jgi:hypothetical protein
MKILMKMNQKMKPILNKKRKKHSFYILNTIFGLLLRVPFTSHKDLCRLFHDKNKNKKINKQKQKQL